MTWRGKFQGLLGGDRAGIAAITAVMLSAMLALTGAAVDIGMLHTAKTELQAAADAAALAGAGTLISYDEGNNVTATPDTALAAAQQVALANQAMGVNLELRSEDVTLGLWVSEAGDFDPDHTGPSSDPDFLSACQVTMRRDSLANSPVPTIFASVVGIDEVPITATATAHLGWVGSVGEGMVDLPIAVHYEAVASGDGVNCGSALVFHNESDETSEWTSFFSWPANDPNVQDYVDGTTPAPALSVGDQMNVINGNLSQNTWEALQDRFQTEGTDLDGNGTADEWDVLLPVMQISQANVATVMGFATLTITEVRDAPTKDVIATLRCGMVMPGTDSGGGNFGTRAVTPKLVK